MAHRSAPNTAHRSGLPHPRNTASSKSNASAASNLPPTVPVITGPRAATIGTRGIRLMLLDADFHFINEEFYAESVTPAQTDFLLADGWRHFGTHFFRYNVGIYEDDIRRVIPLRIRLADYRPSKSQRRILRKNADLETSIGAA